MKVRKGVSPLVALVFSIMFGVMMLVLVLTVITPTLDRAKDSALVTEAFQNLPLLDSAIEEVASEAEGSKRTIALTVTSGKYRVNASRDYIYFTYDPNYETHLTGIKGDVNIERGLKFVDFFNCYVDGSAASPVWTNVSGSWSIDSYKYKGIGGLAHHHVGSFKNYKFSGKITNDSGTGGQIVVMPITPGRVVGMWFFDNRSGSKAYDYSGNQKNGTLTDMNTTGNATSGWNVTNCKSGSCLQFDGVNDFVLVSDSPALDGMGELTVEGWFYPISIDVNDTIVAKTNNSDATNASYLAYICAGNKLCFNVSSSANIVGVSSDNAVTTGRWYHFVGTYNGSGVTLYVDGGVQTETAALTGNVNSTEADIEIGGLGLKGEKYFYGMMDEVRIYNRSLSADDVEAEYELSYKKLFVSDSQNINNKTNITIVLTNPDGQTRFDDIKINKEEKELTFVLPYNKIDLNGTARFPIGEHRVVIEHKGVNTTLNEPIIHISAG